MKNAGQWALLAVVVLAASVKSYSIYATTLEDPDLMPRTIVSGRAYAPSQYRLLAPLLWKGATYVGMNPQAAERQIVLFSILFCYVALAVALYLSSRSIPVTALCLIAFYGAAASGFWFRYRDTFFEVGLTSVGMSLVLRKRPAWGAYCAVSAVAALNRETWLFSLVAAGVSRWAAAGGLAALLARRRRDAIGLVAAGVVAVSVLAGVRAIYGIRPYGYELWQYPTNLRNLLIAGSVRGSLGQAVWFAGSGVFALWLIFAIKGLAKYVPFVLGFTGSLLAVSFLISNWSETRIFISAYAVILVSISGGLVSRAPDSDPTATAS